MDATYAAPYTYSPLFHKEELAWEIFHQLWLGKDCWTNTVLGVPRREHYSSDRNLPYTYGQGDYARTYHPSPWHPAMRVVQDLLLLRLSINFDLCFMNGYVTGQDHLGWHADDSPMIDHQAPIAVVSLGDVRQLWFRPKIMTIGCHICGKLVYEPHGMLCSIPGEMTIKAAQDYQRLCVEKQNVEHGSLLVMAAGMQQTHEHRKPKSDRICSPQMSLTFRKSKP